MARRVETKKEQSREVCVEVLKSEADGLNFSELIRRIHGQAPNLNKNTLRRVIPEFADESNSDLIKTPAGLYKLASMQIQERQPPEDSPSINEESFYAPFADWLRYELEECTKAISLGGNKFKDKWSTPDVIGVMEPQRSDIIQAPIEIISAEIKLDERQLITAFGQACSYCLFSHRSYLVAPQTSSREDIIRLDSLGRLFGIGLVLFDSTNPEEPDFNIRVRAKKQDPDMSYANRYLKPIEKKLFR